MNVHVDPIVLAVVAALTGWVAQIFAKAPAKISDGKAAAILIGLGLLIFGVYALGTPIPAGHAREWALIGVGFVLGPSGIASLSGMLKLAPKSNSL